MEILVVECANSGVTLKKAKFVTFGIPFHLMV